MSIRQIPTHSSFQDLISLVPHSPSSPTDTDGIAVPAGNDPPALNRLLATTKGQAETGDLPMPLAALTAYHSVDEIEQARQNAETLRRQLVVDKTDLENRKTRTEHEMESLQRDMDDLSGDLEDLQEEFQALINLPENEQRTTALDLLMTRMDLLREAIGAKRLQHREKREAIFDINTQLVINGNTLEHVGEQLGWIEDDADDFAAREAFAHRNDPEPTPPPTDSDNGDLDGDGISNRLDRDIDGDGVENFYDGTNGSLMFDPEHSADDDADGVSDERDAAVGEGGPGTGNGEYGVILSIADRDDLDGDGILNTEERRLGTNPILEDSDGDEINDAEDDQPLIYNPPAEPSEPTGPTDGERFPPPDARVVRVGQIAGDTLTFPPEEKAVIIRTGSGDNDYQITKNSTGDIVIVTSKNSGAPVNLVFKAGPDGEVHTQIFVDDRGGDNQITTLLGMSPKEFREKIFFSNNVEDALPPPGIEQEAVVVGGSSQATGVINGRFVIAVTGPWIFEIPDQIVSNGQWVDVAQTKFISVNTGQVRIELYDRQHRRIRIFEASGPGLSQLTIKGNETGSMIDASQLSFGVKIDATIGTHPRHIQGSNFDDEIIVGNGDAIVEALDGNDTITLVGVGYKLVDGGSGDNSVESRIPSAGRAFIRNCQRVVGGDGQEFVQGDGDFSLGGNQAHPHQVAPANPRSTDVRGQAAKGWFDRNWTHLYRYTVRAINDPTIPAYTPDPDLWDLDDAERTVEGQS